jgi:hypothetical protein
MSLNQHLTLKHHQMFCDKTYLSKMQETKKTSLILTILSKKTNQKLKNANKGVDLNQSEIC